MSLSVQVIEPGAPRHPRSKHTALSLVPSAESLLPWRFRFEERPEYAHGVWALLKHQAAAGATESEERYDIVMVFKVRAAKGLCDVRTVKGTRVRNVSTRQLRQMNLDIGTAVEARYKNRKLFYRAAVRRLDERSSALPRFDVEYEDGEREVGLTRDLVRPTAAAVEEFLSARRSLLPALLEKQRRLTHFAALWAERNAAHMAAASAAVPVSGPSDSAVETAVSPQLALSRSEDEHDDLSVRSGASQHSGHTQTSRSQLSVGSKVSSSLSVRKASTKATESLLEERSDIAQPVTRPQLFRVRLQFRVSSYPLRHGWEQLRDEQSGAVYYVNSLSQAEDDEATAVRPSYSAEQVYLLGRAQLAWLRHRARKALRRKVMSLSLEGLIRQTVDKGARAAFVGFGSEGVTAMMLLRRMGYWELADAVEQFHRASKMDLSALTVEQIVDTAKENLETIGVLQTNHQRDVKELQTWWRKTTPQERERKCALLNYHSDPYDTRPLKACIAESEEVLVKKFLRVLKTSASRTKTAVKTVAEESLFPHTHLQIDNYLRRYADKPELARDSVFELVNKHTTHTWVEERHAFSVYRASGGGHPQEPRSREAAPRSARGRKARGRDDESCAQRGGEAASAVQWSGGQGGVHPAQGRVSHAVHLHPRGGGHSAQGARFPPGRRLENISHCAREISSSNSEVRAPLPGLSRGPHPPRAAAFRVGAALGREAPPAVLLQLLDQPEHLRGAGRAVPPTGA